MIKDELLKRQSKRGCREALSHVCDQYVNGVLSLAMGLLNDPPEAEDVVQDVFVSLAGTADEFRPGLLL